LNKQNSTDKPYGFGNTNRRFPSAKRQKRNIAKDRFAYDQALQGNDCQKLGEGGDFLVQKRDFFGGAVGEPTVFKVKTGNCHVTDAQQRRKRKLKDDTE
jgi:hypothetical protein